MHEIKNKLEETARLITQGVKNIDLPAKKLELSKLQDQQNDPGIWEDPAKAQKINKNAAHLAREIEAWEEIQSDANDLIAMIPDISADDDAQGAEEFTQMVHALSDRWRKLEISTFFNGKYDTLNAIIEIHAGTGGTDAQDFAEMLLRMYLRYAERIGHEIELIQKSPGDEAGIKSATFIMRGDFSYGYLKKEAGVHRLVRLSPFNSKHTRETSFALVEVLPELEQSTDINIDSDDLRIDTYRSSAPGGQHVNKTDSAVRITHLPTNLVASCQSERSQLQNKEQCMKILHGKLIDLMEKSNAKELSDLKGEKVEMSWGNQIRSYVLHPYKMVKDHRTDHEDSNPDKILDGDLDEFIEAEIKGGN